LRPGAPRGARRYNYRHLKKLAVDHAHRGRDKRFSFASQAVQTRCYAVTPNLDVEKAGGFRRMSDRGIALAGRGCSTPGGHSGSSAHLCPLGSRIPLAHVRLGANLMRARDTGILGDPSRSGFSIGVWYLARPDKCNRAVRGLQTGRCELPNQANRCNRAVRLISVCALSEI
jgi:hypothetical protein